MTIKSKTKELCEAVTANAIAALEEGNRPWVSVRSRYIDGKSVEEIHPLLPPYNPRTGTYYSGMNVGILWGSAFGQGFDLPYWLTVRQAREIAPESYPLKDTRGTKVVFTKEFEKKDEYGEPVTIPGTNIPDIIRATKVYTVFNVRQFGNLPPDLTAPYPAPRMAVPDIEEFFDRVGAKVRWHGSVDKPHYRQSTDRINMPRFDRFIDARAAYATLAHEMVHWTMAKDRCDRSYTWGWVRHTLNQKLTLEEATSAAYDFEELVAELGANYICAVLGLEPQVRDDSVEYLRGYIRLLGVDPSILLKAHTLAVAGANFVLKKGLDGRKKLPEAPDYSAVPKSKSEHGKLLGKRVGKRGILTPRNKRTKPNTYAQQMAG